MTQIRLAPLAAVLLIFACGGADQQQPEELATTHAALCAGAPQVQGDYVTLIGCPFEQQVYNIVKYGEPISSRALVDADGTRIATVSNSCDSWWLGQDENGLDVLLDSDTGNVLSHGSVHPGLPISVLPDQLPAPFALGN